MMEGGRGGSAGRSKRNVQRAHDSDEEEWEDEPVEPTSRARTTAQKHGRKRVRGTAKPLSASDSGKEPRKRSKKTLQDSVASSGMQMSESRGDYKNWSPKKAPAAISFSTGAPQAVPAHWATKKGAKEAADCRESMDVCRLAGCITMTFKIRGQNANHLIEELSATVASTRVPVELGGGEFGWQTWNDEGEPASTTCFTVSRLQQACRTGKLIPQNSEDFNLLQVLEALNELITPDQNDGSLPWYGQPLIRVVCPRSCSSIKDGTLQVQGFVYLRRLVFFLIAFTPIQTVMNAISPCVEPRRTKKLPGLAQQVFKSSEAAGHTADYPFTLPGIMKGIENSGYHSAVQPAGLAVQMKDYQLQTLKWMQDRETLEHGLNELFWEERCFLDGGVYYFAPELGELRLEQPEAWRGGILSEEMGLGKTLEVLALILSDKISRVEKEKQESSVKAQKGGKKKNKEMDMEMDEDDSLVKTNASLIVVPVHLVSQWMDEITKCLEGPHVLKAVKYTSEDKLHGRCALVQGGRRECDSSQKCPGATGHLIQRMQRLVEGADVVITTYNMLENDTKTLLRVGWRRVILDEMQEIRSSTTELAKICRSVRCNARTNATLVCNLWHISSAVRWMVSGTPLYTSIDDLNGELSFLGVLPFCLSDDVDGFWGLRIKKPFRKRKPEALKLLKVLLEAVMIRHSKSQTYLDGRSILELPDASNRVVAVDMPPSERFVQMYLEMYAVKDIKETMERSQEGSSSLAPRVGFWLRVIREACIAPSLINGGASCSSQLRDIDARLRFLAGALYLNNLIGGQADQNGQVSEHIRSMNPTDALKVLMQARDIKDTSRHHQSHMVRHDAAQQGVYDRARSYAMPTVQERLGEVTKTKEELEACVSAAERFVPLLRWKLALEAVTSGRYFDLARSSLPMLRKTFAHVKGSSELYIADEALQQKTIDRQIIEEEAVAAGWPDQEAVILWQKRPVSVRTGDRQGALMLVDNRTGATVWDSGVTFMGTVVDAGPEGSKGVDRLARDRAKLRSLNDKISAPVPIGMRVAFVKALSSYNAMASDQLSVRRGSAIALCASTPAGWSALGFKYDSHFVLGALVDLEVVSSEVTDMVTHKQFKVVGSIGKVPRSLVEAMNTPKAVGLREQLKKRIDSHIADATAAESKLREITPYYSILQRALAAGAGTQASDTVDQSGFQQLYEIEHGGSPTCCVCQDGCGLAQRPTFMRCAHFACEECIVQWVRFEQSRTNNFRTDQRKATCPLCRKPFSVNDLIRIIPPEKPSNSHASSSKPSGSHTPASKASQAQPAVRGDGGRAAWAGGSDDGPRAGGGNEGPQWCAAATEEALDALPPPQGGVLLRGHVPGSAHYPSFSAQFVSHLYSLCNVPLGSKSSAPCPNEYSSKVKRLLADLATIVEQGRKAVVFSQHKAAVAHLSKVLSNEGFEHVKITRGDSQALQEKAVAEFNDGQRVQVFLLHAGQAAAGLTLTAASDVFLMEPFLRAGEELQAMNRCHRIGQSRNVTCTMYYHPGTIEERMLAYRRFETQEGNDDALSVLDHESSGMLASPEKLKYLLGMEIGDAGNA